MSNIVRLIVYVGLVLCALAFGYCFVTSYHRFMDEQAKLGDIDPDQIKIPTGQRHSTVNNRYAQLLFFGGALFVSVVGLGLLVGHDLSHYAAHRVGKILYDDEGEPIVTSDYETAEQFWADGHPLEAVQLMREYLQKNPREQHVALRIAEIYEKDLNNPLAAALEYEEVLTQKLPTEQWGWTAIHLCNLYFSKLNQPNKAVALLQKIITDYGGTAAAEKARKRLEMHEGPAPVEEASETTAEADRVPEQPENTPLDNSEWRSQFDRYHRNIAPPNEPAD